MFFYNIDMVGGKSGCPVDLKDKPTKWGFTKQY